MLDTMPMIEFAVAISSSEFTIGSSVCSAGLVICARLVTMKTSMKYISTESSKSVGKMMHAAAIELYAPASAMRLGMESEIAPPYSAKMTPGNERRYADERRRETPRRPHR